MTVEGVRRNEDLKAPERSTTMTDTMATMAEEADAVAQRGYASKRPVDRIHFLKIAAALYEEAGQIEAAILTHRIINVIRQKAGM